MNKVTKDKYNDMFYLAENLNTLMKSLQEKCILFFHSFKYSQGFKFKPQFKLFR